MFCCQDLGVGLVSLLMILFDVLFHNEAEFREISAVGFLVNGLLSGCGFYLNKLTIVDFDEGWCAGVAIGKMARARQVQTE